VTTSQALVHLSKKMEYSRPPSLKKLPSKKCKSHFSRKQSYSLTSQFVHGGGRWIHGYSHPTFFAKNNYIHQVIHIYIHTILSHNSILELKLSPNKLS
jgi:hypothetical protein